MSEGHVAAALVTALGAHADQVMGDATSLVSITIDVLGPAAPGDATTTLTRKTRTLVFLSAEFVTDTGARVATASSVHKVAS